MAEAKAGQLRASLSSVVPVPVVSGSNCLAPLHTGRGAERDGPTKKSSRRNAAWAVERGKWKRCVGEVGGGGHAACSAKRASAREGLTALQAHSVCRTLFNLTEARTMPGSGL